MRPYLITAKLMRPSNMKRFPTPELDYTASMTGRQVSDEEQTSTNIRHLSGIRTLGLSAQTIEACAPESVATGTGVTIWRETSIADVCHCCREVVRNVLDCKRGMSTRKKFQTPFVRHISNYVRHAQFFVHYVDKSRCKFSCTRTSCPTLIIGCPRNDSQVRRTN
jgi:hypothetical protein